MAVPGAAVAAAVNLGPGPRMGGASAAAVYPGLPPGVRVELKSR
jgi:hypothetical protein